MAELLEELVVRCGRGDREAAGRLALRFAPCCRQLAWAILGDEHLAEDVTQSALMTALTHLDQLREPRAFAGWLRQIVRTEASRIRRHNRSPAQDLPEAIADGPAPDGNALREELQAIVRHCVAQLADAGRQTVEFYYLQQRDLSDVARMLNIPEGTAKRRLHDARQKLRNMLLGYVQDDEQPGPQQGPYL